MNFLCLSLFCACIVHGQMHRNFFSLSLSCCIETLVGISFVVMHDILFRWHFVHCAFVCILIVFKRRKKKKSPIPSKHTHIPIRASGILFQSAFYILLLLLLMLLWLLLLMLLFCCRLDSGFISPQCVRFFFLLFSFVLLHLIGPKMHRIKLQTAHILI